MIRQLEADAAIAWADDAGRLADWTSTRMVNRDDAYGSYYMTDGGEARSCVKKGPVDAALLRRHFASHGIIGLFTTSKEDTCRWLTIDLDRHDGDPDDFVERNDRLALHVVEILQGLGFRPLLLDSNGRGGRHLTVVLDAPVPARVARAFGLWLVRDWGRFGLPGCPEVFPKQDSIRRPDGDVGYGNFVRLFGRHYKRPHFTRVWGGESWLEGDEAIGSILAVSGDAASLIPEEATACRQAGKPAVGTRTRAWWKAYDADLRKLDVRGLFASRGLRARPDGDRFDVQCPWAAEHTSGGDGAGVIAADPDNNLFPAFHCFHDHCRGRSMEDVLELFGKEAVERHCGAGGQGEPVLDLDDPMGTARALKKSLGDALVHHGGEWWRWGGTKYETVSEHDMRATAWTWLDAARVEVRRAAVPCRPSQALVNRTLDALRAVVNLRGPSEMPRWLGQGDRPRPEDVVAFRNGLLDLGRYLAGGADRLTPHTPEWFSDACLPYEFEPGAACPRWLSFLDDVFEGDGERIRGLARWFGYNLTSDTRQHKFAVLCGPSRSGKGTILRVLGAMLGAENVANPTLSSLGTRFGLAPLVGKLAAIIGDGHLGRHADSAGVLERLKSITGGDRQNVDRKNAPELTNVEIKARFTVAVNELPRLPDASAALRTRMLIFPFGVSFEGREDFELGDRLLEEVPGIANWALEGLKELRRERRLLQPRVDLALLDDFRRLSSPVGAFLEECCRVGSGLAIRTVDLRRAWAEWCHRNGHEPGGEANFGTKLRAVDPRIERARDRVGDGQVYVYKCVALLGRDESTRTVPGGPPFLDHADGFTSTESDESTPPGAVS